MVLRRSGLLLLPLLLLQACSGTPFGQQLAESFDPPTPAPAGVPAKPRAAIEGSPAAMDRAGGARPKPNTQPNPKAKTNPPVQPVVAPASPPSSPQPYRITLRLSAADPAAPAEQVTRSLREAGISFEVETIERIEIPERLSVTPETPGAKP